MSWSSSSGSLCSTGPAVSPEWGLCLLHTNTCSGSRDLVKNKSWGLGGLASERGAVKGIVHFFLNGNN